MLEAKLKVKICIDIITNNPLCVSGSISDLEGVQIRFHYGSSEEMNTPKDDRFTAFCGERRVIITISGFVRELLIRFEYVGYCHHSRKLSCRRASRSTFRLTALTTIAYTCDDETIFEKSNSVFR